MSSAVMSKKCIVRGCDSISTVRGCCHNHYHRVYRAIKSGAISSWQEASRKGWAIAIKSKPGPKR